MGRFDVYRLSGEVPLVVEVQANIHSHLATTLVIPLHAEATGASIVVPQLMPLLRLAGSEYRLITPHIATLPRSMLGSWFASVEDQRTVVVDAIDFLLKGF